MSEKDLSKIILSKEIRDLVQDVDKLINRKDILLEDLKKLYLTGSTNN